MKRSRIIFVLLVLALTTALAVKVPDPVYAERPEVEAAWFVQKPSGNVIGEVIVVTLRVTHPRGVYLVLGLPDVGGSLDGSAEIRKRTVSQSGFFSFILDVQVVTEVRYELQYLVPIDFSQPETKVVGPGRQLSFKYLLKEDGKVGWKYDAVLIHNADPDSEFTLGFAYSLVRRVDESSRPYGVLGQWPIPLPWGWLAQALGVFVLVVAAVKFLRRRIKSSRKSHSMQPPDSTRETTIRQLYQMWRLTGDYRIFAEAVRLYREPFFTGVMAGKVSPPVDWEETSAILYSRKVLDTSAVEEVFQRILKEEGRGWVAPRNPSIASGRRNNV